MIGFAVDAILGLVVVEAIGLALLHHWRGLGIPPKRVLGTLAAGFFLMLALRLALAGQDALVWAALLAALLAHLVDLRSRWQRR